VRLPLLEPDGVNDRAGWVAAPPTELRAEVAAALEGSESTHGQWVVDGDDRSLVADLLTPDTDGWLDHPDGPGRHRSGRGQQDAL